MRKILAGFLATSMIVAVASSVTFAASSTITASAADLKVKPVFTATDGSTLDGVGTGKALKVNVAVTGLTFTIDGESFTIPVEKEFTKSIAAVAYSSNFTFDSAADITVATSAEMASLLGTLDDESFNNVHYDGNVYSGTIKVVGGTVTLNFDKAIIASAAPTSSVKLETSVSYNAAGLDLTSSSTAKTFKTTGDPTGGISGGSVTGTTTETPYADVEKSGTLDMSNISVDDVLVCDGDGNPMVYTENPVGVDEDQNGEGGVQSGKTLYFMIRDDGVIPELKDDTYWKLKVTKGDNGKYIKAISDVSKNFSGGLNTLKGGIDQKTKGRHRYIKVEMNEIFTDDEYKITLDMRISAKSKAVNAKLKVGNKLVTDDSEIKVKDFYFYMKNMVKDADNDWKVGIGGLMLNPISNDWNDVTYYDEDGDLAHVKFFADSDTSKFYAKLSTKWEHADYASYFNDQDAYIFDFTGSPKLSSTSRADLEIYNPFVDEDGSETIDPASAVIYQVIDGDLFDVTDSFEYKEGENGDMAYVTRTRFLGTYIICEKAVEEAADTEAPETDLVPEEAPSEVTPDGGSNDGGKAPANTGKYL